MDKGVYGRRDILHKLKDLQGDSPQTEEIALRFSKTEGFALIRRVPVGNGSDKVVFGVRNSGRTGNGNGNQEMEMGIKITIKHKWIDFPDLSKNEMN